MTIGPAQAAICVLFANVQTKKPQTDPRLFYWTSALCSVHARHLAQAADLVEVDFV